MSLINASLQIGRSAIQASEAAIQVIGHNIANASNPNYARQRPVLEAITGSEFVPGVRSGLGVRLETIRRLADEAVNTRLRTATSDRSAAEASSGMLAQIETVFNALGDDNLSTRMTEFFNAFSELANDPQSMGRRSLLLQAGSALARDLQAHHSALLDERLQINNQLLSLTDEANGLLTDIASLNEQITRVEHGMVSTTAGSLHDQRDAALARLSELMDINTQAGSNGAMNVYLGSAPVVMGGDTFVLEAAPDTEAAYADVVIRQAESDSVVNVTGGEIGGLIASRDGALTDALDGLDQLALTVINEVNKLHAEGQGLVGFSAIASDRAASSPTAALNAAGLDLTPVNGTFRIHVTDSAGTRTAYDIAVDLDGLGGDTTLQSLASSLDALAYVTASVTPDNRLSITATSGRTITFSEDSSNVLAALGVNAFFSGRGSDDIAVRNGLEANQIAAASNHLPLDNSNALRLAALADAPLDELGGNSLGEYYRDLVANLAGQASEASFDFESQDALLETLTSQRDAISGVSVDEEAIDLMQYQRAFQGAAHYISIINEMLDELLQLV